MVAGERDDPLEAGSQNPIQRGCRHTVFLWALDVLDILERGARIETYKRF
jgi:hypothetical protein